MIFAIAVLIAFMIASMLSGDEVKQPMVIVNGEIDVTKTLGEQLDKFSVIPISQNESTKLGDSVVRSLEELKDARIAIQLSKGSPIPKALLAVKKTGGDFALETPEHRTWYRFAGGIAMLPPGVAEGDLIDISILYKLEDGSNNSILKLMLSSVEIALKNEVDIYVKVPQDEFEMLTVSAGIGQFVLQLPGQKKVERCEDLLDEEIENSDCYYESNKPGMITTEDVKKMILEGEKEVIPTPVRIEKPVVEEPKEAEEKPVVEEPKDNDGSIFDEETSEEVTFSPNEQVEERKKKDSLIQDFFR